MVCNQDHGRKAKGCFNLSHLNFIGAARCQRWRPIGVREISAGFFAFFELEAQELAQQGDPLRPIHQKIEPLLGVNGVSVKRNRMGIASANVGILPGIVYGCKFPSLNAGGTNPRVGLDAWGTEPLRASSPILIFIKDRVLLRGSMQARLKSVPHLYTNVCPARLLFCSNLSLRRFAR